MFAKVFEVNRFLIATFVAPLAFVVSALLCTASVAAEKDMRIEPFNLEQSRLAPNFLGADAFELLRAVQANPPPAKSQFETSSTFDGRTQDWQRRRLIGALTPSDLFAVVLTRSDRESWRALQYSYDADRGEWRIEISSQVPIRQTMQSGGSYTGSNSLGAKRKVEIIQKTVFALSATSHTTAVIKMDPETARAISKDLAIALLCRMSAPFLSVAELGGMPTVTRPLDVREVRTELHVESGGLVVFNRRTGEILYRPISEAEDARGRASGRTPRPGPPPADTTRLPDVIPALAPRPPP